MHKPSTSVSPFDERPCSALQPGRCQSCDLSVENCHLNAADAGQFTNAKNTGNGRLQYVIDGDETILDPASDQGGQFKVRYQMKSAGQVVASDMPPASILLKCDGFQSTIPLRDDRPAFWVKSGSGRGCAKIDCLHQLAGLRHQVYREWNETSERRLLANGHHSRAMLCKVCRHRQQQRACSGNDYTLPAQRQSAARHRIESANTHHVGQRPTGEGQETLPCACGKYEGVIAQLGALFSYRRDERVTLSK